MREFLLIFAVNSHFCLAQSDSFSGGHDLWCEIAPLSQVAGGAFTDLNIGQSVGLSPFAASDPTVGTNDEFTMSVQPIARGLVTRCIINEVTTCLGFRPLVRESLQDLRSTVLYRNEADTALLFYPNNLDPLICGVRLEDQTYESIYLGLFVLANTEDSGGKIKAGFVNGVTNGMEVPGLQMGKEGGGSLMLACPDWANHYELGLQSGEVDE